MPSEAMKVWPNRYPVEMIERAKARAASEGVEPAALLREVLGRALDQPNRIMPRPRPADATSNGATKQEPGAPCAHPRAQRRPLGYVTMCGACGGPVR